MRAGLEKVVGRFADFQKTLGLIESEAYLEEDILEAFQSQKEGEKTYSLEELLEGFRVIPAYEKMITTALRSSQIEVLQPSNRVFCKTHQLTFVLSKAVSIATSIRIENNQMNDLVNVVFPKGQTTLTVDLPKDLFSPGLYYWKLWNEKDLVMGSFLVTE